MKENKLVLALLPVLILALFLVFRGQLFESKGNPEQEYYLALKYIGESKLQEARKLLEKGLAKEPGEGKYHFALGNIARLESDLEQAFDQYMQAIQKTPQLKEAYNNAAGILMMQNKPDESLSIVEKGLQQDPGFKDLLFKKGQLLYSKGSFAEAELILLPLAADPKYVEAYRFIGLGRLKQGERGQGLEVLKTYLNQAPISAQGRADIEKIVKDAGESFPS